MGRPLRIEYPGAFYHITSRGNERRPIYRAKQDYDKFTGYLESASQRYGARIHCFCLMPNHYHLLLETPKGNLQTILHHLNTSYTNYFNSRTKRVGHLFQGRYRAILVEKDSYALELSRYIHLNPVRARLVEDPSRYPWSSCLAYVDRRNRWDWLKTDLILGYLGSGESKVQKRYWNFTKEGIGRSLKDPTEKTVASTVLGSDNFVEWVREKLIKKGAFHRDVPSLKRLSSWPDLSTIQREAEKIFGQQTPLSRRVALYLSHQFSGLSLGEIAGYYGGIGTSAVCQNTMRLGRQIKKDRELFMRIEKLKKGFSE